MIAQIVGAVIQNHGDDKLDAVNLKRHRALDLAPFSIVILCCGLTLSHPAEASLFDPERGRQQAGEATTNSGGSLPQLRLDGILTLGDHHRVLIGGPEGETYRFNWRGVIDEPMAFNGKLADRLAGYKLTSADARSVWLQLPSETSCAPDPEKGIAACEKGRVKLALVRRDFPQKAVENAAGNGVQQGASRALVPRPQQGNSSPLTNYQTRSRSTELEISRTQTQEEQQRVINSAPVSYFGYAIPSASPESSAPAAENSGGSSAQQGNSPASTSDSQQPTTQQQTPSAQQPVVFEDSPEQAQLREEQQRLIDSAPPGYWGVE